MGNTVVTEVTKSAGWTEVGSGIASGFMSFSCECLYVIAATTPSLSYGHRTIDSMPVTFIKTGSDKIYVKSDQSEKVVVVITPA